MRPALALAALLFLLPPALAGPEPVHEVAIRDRAFSPALVVAGVLDVVRWTQFDGIVHSVTSVPAGFDSGDLGPGATYERSFDSPGVVVYRCKYHLTMVGVIVVQ